MPDDDRNKYEVSSVFEYIIIIEAKVVFNQILKYSNSYQQYQNSYRYVHTEMQNVECK